MTPNPPTATDVPPTAGRREWAGLAVLALACAMYAMDLTVLHLAVPAMTADMRPSSGQLLWIIDVYGFLVAGSLITMGSLGDRLGRRRLLLIGAAAFGVTSVLAALASTPAQLIAARAALGLAGATIAPSTLSLIATMFSDPAQRTRAIGLWITSFSVGGAVGPVLGGLVIERFWWGASFLLAVPVMVLLLVLGPRVLPEYRDPGGGRIDLRSAALLLVSLLAVVQGLKLLAQDGLSRDALLALALGLVVGAVFVRRQRRLEDPLLDLSLFAIPEFGAAVAVYGFAVFAVFGGFLFIPQHLQLVLGMSPLEAGLWTLPWALSFVISSNLVPVVAARVEGHVLMGCGLLVAAVGFAGLLGVGEQGGLAVLTGASVLFSVGLSPLFILTNDLIVGAAPPAQAGTAAGISETAAELGGALGIAVLGSIGVAAYRAGMADAVPAELSASAAEAARGTLGGALDVAATLPADAAAALVTAATGSFTTGLHVVATCSAALSLLLGVVVLRGRRGLRASPKST